MDIQTNSSLFEELGKSSAAHFSVDDLTLLQKLRDNYVGYTYTPSTDAEKFLDAVGFTEPPVGYQTNVYNILIGIKTRVQENRMRFNF